MLVAGQKREDSFSSTKTFLDVSGDAIHTDTLEITQMAIKFQNLCSAVDLNCDVFNTKVVVNTRALAINGI